MVRQEEDARTKTLILFSTALIALAAATSCRASSESTPQAPDPDSGFVFTAGGDYGSDEDATATLDLIARSGASFNLALGDLSYTDATEESAWCDHVRSRVGAEFPFQLTAGNHEDDFGEHGHISEFAACLPDKLSSVGSYPEEYYFDYQGLARFVMISPDLTIDGEHFFYGGANDHYDWVANAIDDARAAGIPWVVVGMHKNCLSVGEYYCNVYQELMSLLIEKKVDLVLQAHEHTYQRTRQLGASSSCPVVEVDSFDSDCVVDDGEDDSYTKGAGTVFVVTWAAGAELYDVNPDDPEAGYFVEWMGANSDPRKGFVESTVSETDLAVEFVGSTATSDFADEFAIGEPE